MKQKEINDELVKYLEECLNIVKAAGNRDKNLVSKIEERLFYY